MYNNCVWPIWILRILLLANSGLVIIACITTRVRKYVNRHGNCAVRWRDRIEFFFFLLWTLFQRNETTDDNGSRSASIRVPSVDRYCISWTDRKEFAVVKQSKCASRYFKIIIINIVINTILRIIIILLLCYRHVCEKQKIISS